MNSDIPASGDEDTEPKVFVYRIDHADQIITVDDPWLEFASGNGAPELNRENVVHQAIWHFICDPDTQLIYRLVFDAVRTKLKPITITYRCDSPTLRRYMQLTCSPMPKQEIEFRSSILREEPRKYVPILDNKKPRSNAVVTICAWCKRCRVAEFDWREIENAIPEVDLFSDSLLPQVSHGMCPTCHLAKLKEIRSGTQTPG